MWDYFWNWWKWVSGFWYGASLEQKQDTIKIISFKDLRRQKLGPCPREEDVQYLDRLVEEMREIYQRYEEYMECSDISDYFLGRYHLKEGHEMCGLFTWHGQDVLVAFQNDEYGKILGFGCYGISKWKYLSSVGLFAVDPELPDRQKLADKIMKHIHNLIINGYPAGREYIVRCAGHSEKMKAMFQAMDFLEPRNSENFKDSDIEELDDVSGHGRVFFGPKL